MAVPCVTSPRCPFSPAVGAWRYFRAALTSFNLVTHTTSWAYRMLSGMQKTDERGVRCVRLSGQEGGQEGGICLLSSPYPAGNAIIARVYLPPSSDQENASTEPAGGGARAISSRAAHGGAIRRRAPPGRGITLDWRLVSPAEGREKSRWRCVERALALKTGILLAAQRKEHLALSSSRTCLHCLMVKAAPRTSFGCARASRGHAAPSCLSSRGRAWASCLRRGVPGKMIAGEL
jgi:hypothetical protein